MTSGQPEYASHRSREKLLKLSRLPCNNDQMDWRDFHVLAILRSEGSLAGAARALGVNHATISRRIASLEADVGEPLVRRLARSTPLTDKGRDLAAIATEMLTSAQRIERLVKARGSSLSGTVRLTAPPVFVSETLIPTLPSFRRVHPHLRLILSSDAQLASLDAGQADLAVRLVQPTEAFRAQGFQPKVIGARGNRPVDPRLE